MRFGMLGPLRVRDGSGWSPIGAPQQRVVLAVLLIEAGRVVSAERLTDELWGQQVPRQAASVLRGYVLRLRRLLSDGPDGLLVTRGGGYELAVGDSELDAGVFARLVASGRAELAAHQPGAAADGLDEALRLWRGPALADVPASPTVTAWAARLEQARLGAVEERLEALLRLGRNAEAVEQARWLASEQPLRERGWAQLMTALYRCGRRAEALEAYQSARGLLVAELGVEPGAELQRLQHQVLAEDPELAAPPVPARSGVRIADRVVPAQLPAEVPGFTGRQGDLKQLDALLPGDGDPHPVLVISAISGAAGVGKTALAVRFAHQVRARFPDGQLYVNLRGWAAGVPLSPLDALARFLPTLGVPSEQVPDELEAAAALYRSLLADRRALVLLDNARDPDQVRPLLPASPGSLVLVTSRDRLGGLIARDGAVRLDLDVLTPAEAEQLLARLLGSERIAAEPSAAAELASLCGHLPLALRIAAANLTGCAGRSIAEHVTRLRGAGRLAALEVQGDPQASVRAAYGLSYASLPVQARRLFRLLGLHPGPDVTARAAAALADISPGDAERLLERLADAHLIDGHAAGRYALHDLLRLYAAEQATAEESPAARQAAAGRLYDHYLHQAGAAADQLYPEMLRLPAGHTAGTAEGFDDHAQASAWLDAERPNLVTAVTHAAAHGHPEVAWRLADSLRGHLYLGMHTIEWHTVAEAGLAAARADGDPQAQAAAHLSLATLHWIQGRAAEAIGHNTKALELSRRASWDEGQCAALGSLGNVRADLGQLSQAADHYAGALAIARRTGQHAVQPNTLTNLGSVYQQLGQLHLAADHHAQALAAARQAGNRDVQAGALINLAESCHALGRLRDALDTLDQALTLSSQLEHRPLKVELTRIQAAVHRDAGRHAQALDLASDAVTLAHDADTRWYQAQALATKAAVHHQLGDHQQALEGHQRALDLARATGNRYTQTEALIGLAAARHHTGDPDQALDDAAHALVIARHDGYRLLEGNALITQAAVHLTQGRPGQAIDHARQAQAIHAKTGHRLGQARAHLVAAHAMRSTGEDRQAQAHQLHATDLFTEIGAPMASHARATLGQAAP